jgi:hypothetical protein
MCPPPSLTTKGHSSRPTCYKERTYDSHKLFSDFHICNVICVHIMNERTNEWKCNLRAGKIAQQLRVLAILTEDLSSAPNTYAERLIAICNSSFSGDPMPSLSGLYRPYTPMYTSTHRHKNKNESFQNLILKFRKGKKPVFALSSKWYSLQSSLCVQYSKLRFLWETLS